MESTSAPVATAEERQVKSSSRKSHRKTRTGCKTCKQRKIKCDETKPQCNNCIKHSVRCDFTNEKTPSEPSPSAGFVSQVGTPIPVGTPNNGISPGMTVDRLHGLQPPGLNLTDLELLHNYSMNTATTLHSDPTLRVLLRTTVPQLGFSCEYVMRGVLALSALHLARFKPEKRDFYLAQAAHHQEIGLRAASSIIPHIVEENCSAVYIFSVFALYAALASPRKPGDFLIVGDNGIADWLFLIKGTSYIMQAKSESLRKGPLGPLLNLGHRRHEFRQALASETPSGGDPITELRDLIHTKISDREQLNVYDHAIEGLWQCYLVIYNRSFPLETGDLFVWLFQATDRYLQLIREHTPVALIILAHFCALMKHLEHYWWMEGWSTDLISKIYYILDEEYKLWIRWPIEEIGWIPK